MAPPNAILGQTSFGQDPLLPGLPIDSFGFHVPRTPTVFSVTMSQDGTRLLFTVGYGGLTTLANFTHVMFNVYFAPISAANQAAIADPTTAANFFRNATLVNTISAPIGGGNATFSDTRFVTTDGWFWATAINQLGYESEPTIPYRSPAAGTLINLAIPPNVSGQAVSKTTVTVDGLTYSKVKASCIVPSNNTGVISVTVTNTGAGYTSPPTVSFSGGLAAGGTAATGSAVINTLGQVVGVQISNSGSGYVSAPTVVFGSGAAAAQAYLGYSTAFDGFQLYLTNYFAGSQVEGPYVNASNSVPGTTITGMFLMIPDPGHTTTFTFVSVSRAGVRSLSGAPTATLIV